MCIVSNADGVATRHITCQQCVGKALRMFRQSVSADIRQWNMIQDVAPCWGCYPPNSAHAASCVRNKKRAIKKGGNRWRRLDGGTLVAWLIRQRSRAGKNSEPRMWCRIFERYYALFCLILATPKELKYSGCTLKMAKIANKYAFGRCENNKDIFAKMKKIF